MRKTSVTEVQGKELQKVQHIIDRGPKGNYFTEITSPSGFPRLQRHRTVYSRLGPPDELFWIADGAMKGTLDEAVAWINDHPIPEVTITESALLDVIATEFANTPVPPMNLTSLRAKGLVEFETDSGARCRRTPLAEEVLNHAAAH